MNLTFNCTLFGLVLLVLLPSFTHSDPPGLQWYYTYGDSLDNRAYDIVETSDGGYAFTGFTEVIPDTDADFWLVKLNSDGVLEWESTYGGDYWDEAKSILLTPDGGILLGGITSNGAGETDLLLTKTDASGNLEWQRTYGGSDNEEFADVDHTQDGGFVLAAGVGTYPDKWILLIKTDSYGNVEWEHLINPDTTETGGIFVKDVIETSDNNYLITSYTHHYFFYWFIVWITKVSAEGDIIWNYSVEYGTSNYALSCIEVSEGPEPGYICLGRSDNLGEGDSSPRGNVVLGPWLLKLDCDGNFLWDSPIPESELFPMSFTHTQDGQFTITGGCSSYDAIELIEMNSTGVFQWQENYPTPGLMPCGTSVIQRYDGSYAVAGYTLWDMTQPPRDAIVLATESLTGISAPEGSNLAELQPFHPNPSHAPEVRFNLEEPTTVEFFVFDLSGRVIQKITQAEYPAGSHTYVINPLTPGVYFCRMASGDFSATERFVVIE